jgi:hypothetical protein
VGGVWACGKAPGGSRGLQNTWSALRCRTCRICFGKRVFGGALDRLFTLSQDAHQVQNAQAWYLLWVILAWCAALCCVLCRAAQHVHCRLWACLRCANTYWGSPWVSGVCCQHASQHVSQPAAVCSCHYHGLLYVVSAVLTCAVDLAGRQ